MLLLFMLLWMYNVIVYIKKVSETSLKRTEKENKNKISFEYWS